MFRNSFYKGAIWYSAENFYVRCCTPVFLLGTGSKTGEKKSMAGLRFKQEIKDFSFWIKYDFHGISMNFYD